MAGFILVFFTFFVPVRSPLTWNRKEIQISKKKQIFRIFQKNPLKVILKFSIFRLFSINNKKNKFWLSSWSLPVCCLPLMFSAESEMFRNVHHWISYDQRCQNWSRLVQLWTLLKTQKYLNQRWKWLNIYESSTREPFWTGRHALIE